MDILHFVLDVCGVLFLVYILGVIIAYGVIKGSEIKDNIRFGYTAWRGDGDEWLWPYPILSWLAVIIEIGDRLDAGDPIGFRFTAPKS